MEYYQLPVYQIDIDLDPVGAQGDGGLHRRQGILRRMPGCTAVAETEEFFIVLSTLNCTQIWQIFTDLNMLMG